MASPITFIACLCICLASQIYGWSEEESNEKFLEDLVCARHKLALAKIKKCVFESKIKHYETLNRGYTCVIEFRTFIFSNYDLSEKEVDECINKEISGIENEDIGPDKCNKDEAYCDLEEKICKEFTEKTLLEEAKQECKEPKEFDECVEKVENKVLQGLGYDESQLEAKLKKLETEADTCVREVENIYLAARKEIEKSCPKK